MLASIHPLGERVRRNRWWLTAAAHVLGSASGGALAGAALGGVAQLTAGPLLRGAPGVALAIAICGLAAVVDGSGRRLPWPVHRQVDDGWMARYRGWVYGAGFGFQLGLGVVTIVTTAAVPAVWLLALVTASPVAGAAVGLAFGLSRGLPVLATAGVDTPARLWSFQRRFQASGAAARWATVGSLGALAVGGAAGLWAMAVRV
jgi:sulfite exporter TauE/SafE